MNNKRIPRNPFLTHTFITHIFNSLVLKSAPRSMIVDAIFHEKQHSKDEAVEIMLVQVRKRRLPSTSRAIHSVE